MPTREERIDQLRTLIGPEDPHVAPLVRAIRRGTTRRFERHVVPLVKAHWPATLSDPFAGKLRYLACNIYATAPYLVLLCAPGRPAGIRAATRLACAVRLPPVALSWAGHAALRLFMRTSHVMRQRRVVYAAAFVAVVDHAFDGCMPEPPEERGEVLKRVIDGGPAMTPPLRLASALLRAMSNDLEPDEQPHFDAAMGRLKQWVDSEVRGATDRTDPSGQGHRIAGVKGTIDGVLFPFHRFAGEAARQWMYDASLLIQMIDDYVDLDADAATERVTPVQTGDWTFEHIAAAWHDTGCGLEDLVREGGLGAPHYVHFIRRAYESIMREGLEAVQSGLAD